MKVKNVKFITKTKDFCVFFDKLYKFNFKKNKLVKEGYDPSLTEHQIMLNRKIHRIYDSGNLIFKIK